VGDDVVHVLLSLLETHALDGIGSLHGVLRTKWKEREKMQMRRRMQREEGPEESCRAGELIASQAMWFRPYWTMIP
jgi:hypothetical protein